MDIDYDCTHVFVDVTYNVSLKVHNIQDINGLLLEYYGQRFLIYNPPDTCL